MDTTCFWSSEKLYYLPLIRLGLSCHLVELLYLTCSLLWNICFVLELHFHWILGEFVTHEHVVYHVYHHHYVTFPGNFKSWYLCNGLISSHLIDFMAKTVSKVSLIMYLRRSWCFVCIVVVSIDFQNVSALWLLLLFIAIKKRQWCLECILKFEGFAKTIDFLLCSDLLM